MKLAPSSVQTIAVLRALQLGDMLCTTPAFRALRNAYPRARITLLGLPWAKSFTQRYHDVWDDFIHFPGYEGLPEQPYDPGAFQYFLEFMRSSSFDLLIQMQGNGSIVNDLVTQMGARQIAGYYQPAMPPPSPLFMEYPVTGSEKSRHIRLMEFLEIPVSTTHLEFPLPAEDYKEFDSLEFGLKPRQYVCIHAGSRSVARQWNPVYFGALADVCAQMGLTPVLTGTANEADVVREVSKNIHCPHINLTGKTSMGAVAVLIQNAAMLIANSTGVAHLADALDTPSVVISLDGEAERWKPENERIHRLTDWTTNSSFEQVVQDTKDILKMVKPRPTPPLRA